ncbi:hypothetical protein [Methylobacterium sp. WL2]|uniref:hypothetical protein n=1 Tax=Methylobacterium sp. WL2 TaxID=2603902 RepID=UPI0011C71B60|nr:hypothetical protein [Methylobacterium sp. WL2]TXN51621.1 hypothetical protein FV241_30010 [Methylobacterium sp. WL2]
MTGAIIKPSATLRSLPKACQVSFDGRPPWAVVSTTGVVAALGIDRGLLATWRNRGIGPTELPASWFRPAVGQPRHYQISAVLAWLADQHGEAFDAEACWVDHLRSNLGAEFANMAWVRRLAGNQSLVQGDARFTANGFRQFLALFQPDAAIDRIPENFASAQGA